MPALRLQIELFEDVQHLDQGDATRTGRCHRDDVVAAVGAPDRGAFHGSICCKVLFRDQPAVGFHVGCDEVRNGTRVERVGPSVRDRAQRPAQVRQHEPIFLRPQPAAWLAVRGDGGREARHRSRDFRIETAGERRRQRESLLRQHDGRLHDVFPGELAELLVGQLEPAHAARHPGRKVPGLGQPSIDRPVRTQIHRRGRSERRLLPVVERRELTARSAHDHEAPASDVASGRVCHREREGRGDGGIDGVAASGQHRRADVAGGSGDADDQAVPGPNANVLCHLGADRRGSDKQCGDEESRGSEHRSVSV